MTVATNLRVVLLTDLHLNPHHVPSLNRLAALADEIDALDPHVVACTGDVVAAHANGGMKVVRRFLDGLGRPWLCTPGNKDIAVSDARGGRDRFIRVFGDAPRVWTRGEYGLVGLDTAGDGITKYQCAGLGAEQWSWLNRQLEQLRRRGVSRLVCCMHMPLGAIGQPDRRRLIDLLTEFGVTTVLAGHRHRNAVNHYEPVVEYVTAPCLPINGPSDPPTLRLLKTNGDEWQTSLVAVEAVSTVSVGVPS